MELRLNAHVMFDGNLVDLSWCRRVFHKQADFAIRVVRPASAKNAATSLLHYEIARLSVTEPRAWTSASKTGGERHVVEHGSRCGQPQHTGRTGIPGSRPDAEGIDNIAAATWGGNHADGITFAGKCLRAAGQRDSCRAWIQSDQHGVGLQHQWTAHSV